jgi:hypothetical protein
MTAVEASEDRIVGQVAVQEIVDAARRKEAGGSGFGCRIHASRIEAAAECLHEH